MGISTLLFEYATRRKDDLSGIDKQEERKPAELLAFLRYLQHKLDLACAGAEKNDTAHLTSPYFPCYHAGTSHTIAKCVVRSTLCPQAQR